MTGSRCVFVSHIRYMALVGSVLRVGRPSPPSHPISLSDLRLRSQGTSLVSLRLSPGRASQQAPTVLLSEQQNGWKRGVCVLSVERTLLSVERGGRFAHRHCTPGCPPSAAQRRGEAVKIPEAARIATQADITAAAWIVARQGGRTVRGASYRSAAVRLAVSPLAHIGVQPRQKAIYAAAIAAAKLE
jgi:hypothetical protein